MQHSSLRMFSDEAVLAGLDRRLGAAVHIELAEDIVDVLLGGADADHQGQPCANDPCAVPHIAV